MGTEASEMYVFVSADRLEKYRELWKPVQYGKSILSKTIDMDELVKVMEEFDIDKDLITVDQISRN